jgi:large subunit ribosomal protein L13
MKTFSLKAGDVETAWHVVDAEGQPLGRLATRVALLLRGKHRPTYTPHLDNGDFVIVVNAAKVRFTGSKSGQKIYYRHTGYPGGLKETILDKMMDKHPDRVVQKAVKGMLPHNRLSRKLLGHLKIYGGPEHPHEAQVNAGKTREPVAAKESA